MLKNQHLQRNELGEIKGKKSVYFGILNFLSFSCLHLLNIRRIAFNLFISLDFTGQVTFFR